MSLESAIVLARQVLICPFEGYHVRLPDGGCRAYPDPGTGGSPWTIGWGSIRDENGQPILPGTVWTRAQADASLDAEIAEKVSGLAKLSPSLSSEPDRRIAALISFAYNCGLGNYRVSTLRKRVNLKDWGGAAEEIVKWDKAHGKILAGLTRRRHAEALMLR